MGVRRWGFGVRKLSLRWVEEVEDVGSGVQA